jgi:MFS family permease
MLLSQFPTFAKVVLHGDESTVTLLLAIFTLGIGSGSFVCEKFSHHRIRLSLVALGGVGMGCAGVDFALTSFSFSCGGDLFDQLPFYHLLTDLFFVGFFGGVYSVPLYALMQSRSKADKRSRTIGANNIFNALLMVGGAVGVMISMGQGATISEIFLTLAILTLIVGVMVWWLLNKKSEEGWF